MTKKTIVALGILLLPRLAGAQNYTIAPSPFQTVLDNNGLKVSGACVWTYTAGTTTPAPTYADTAGTPNSNPIQADGSGRFTAYLLAGASYKFIYETACTPPAHGTTLRTADNIAGVPSSAATVDLTGTAGETLGAGQCVYLSDGSGGKTAGQWYKCDSAALYSSVTPEVGIAPAAIATAASGAIRIAGSVTGLSSLSVGSEYFVGSAGAITTTAPAHARHLGHADTTTTLVLTANPSAPTSCAVNLTGQTASYAATLCDLVEFTSGSSLTLTLPAASGCSAGKDRIGLKNDTANAITVARTGTDTIDGGTSFTTVGAQYESYDFVCNAAKTGWMVR